MRLDYEVLKQWIKQHADVLDLGCGDGALLQELEKSKQVLGYGLEIDGGNIQRCVEKNINVLEQDIDEGLSNFADQSFDTVIMSQAIQTLHNPHKALEEMLRVGRQCIITFPNFGHWRARLHLMFNGRMPVSDLLPFEWYDTPNIHFCTFKDFDVLCRQMNIRVLNREVVAQSNVGQKLQQINPNVFGETALYRVTR